MATIEAMYLVAQSVLFVCITYFMCGFTKTAAAFFWFLLFSLLGLLFFSAPRLMLRICANTPDMD